MELDDRDRFIIKTLAAYTLFDSLEREKIITKEQFEESYGTFTREQHAVIKEYIEENIALMRNFTRSPRFQKGR